MGRRGENVVAILELEDGKIRRDTRYYAERDDRCGFPCERRVYRHIPYAESLGYSLKISARVEPFRDDGVRAPSPRVKRVHVGRCLVVGIEHAKSLGSLGGGRENWRDFVPSGGQDPLGFGRSCGGVEAEGDPPLCCVFFLVHHIT